MLGALPCDGGRRSAAAALLLSGWLQLGRALRVPAVAADDGGRTYLWHKDCRTADGLGGHVIKVRPYIGIAVQNHWTFVCNPKDWETAMHSTGNMGFLFGCNSESEVKGDLASYNSVKHLPFVTLGETDGGLAKPNTVYTTKECKSMPPWGESWHWFRKQFHLVRESDPERQHPRCWPAAVEGAPQRKNVVIAMRKGDDPTRSKHADVYLRLLGALFEGKLPDVTAVPASDAHVVIISEATEGDPDVQQLNNSLTNSGIASSFFIGAAEKDYVAARQRLVRDLDCMAQADVLVASLSGLSDLAAAVQRPPGVTLVLDGKSRRHDGIPNARKVSVQRGSRSGIESWPGELPNAVHVRFSLPEAPGAVDCPLCSRLHAAEFSALIPALPNLTLRPAAMPVARAALLGLLAASPVVALRHLSTTGEEELTVALEPECKCLSYADVYQNRSVRCGDAFEQRGIHNCNYFYEKLHDTHCWNKDKMDPNAGQWCYVALECQTLDGGARVKKAPVNWKTCKKGRDQLSSISNVKSLVLMAKRYGLDPSEVFAMAYPPVANIPFYSEVKPILLQRWNRVKDRFNMTGLEEHEKKSLVDVMTFGPRSIIQSEDLKPPQGIVEGFNIYEISTNEDLIKEPWEVKYKTPFQISKVTLVKSADGFRGM